jgi:hypothetical protein
MSMRTKLVGLIFLAILIFSSCRNSPTSVESIIGVNLSADKINSSIKLVDAPEFSNSHKNGEALILHLVNTSNSIIVFPENYGIKLLANLDGKWTEIPNRSYNVGNPINLPTSTEFPLGLFVTTLPYVSGLSNPISIRVIIIGHKKDSNEEVGAYLDVIITP